YREKELAQLEHLKEVYEAVGYQVIGSSFKSREGIEEIKALLKDKTSLISGHSGVGKSTFINTIIPDAGIRTQDVSGWSQKGQ
ncbi:MAG: ribosome small subunit-dependent GTPase A, partial [Chitinophagaceae bacterium]